MSISGAITVVMGEYVKVGMLDLNDEGRKSVRPTAHVFSTTKIEWVDLNSEKEKGIPVFEEY